MNEAPRARIGLFGGAFDPIHRGHLMVARAACEQLALERVVFVPSGTPPHKAIQGETSAQHRLAMTRLATASEPRFEVSPIEATRPDKAFTVDTVAAFAQRWPTAELFFIFGDDCAARLHRWKGLDRLLAMARFVSVHRTGARPDRKVESQVIALDVPALPVSSTQLRERLATGEAVDEWVPRSVVDYIRIHALYRAEVPA